MCQWCQAILKRSRRYTSKVLDLSINLYFRLALEEHFSLQQLAWLNSMIPKEDYAFHVSRYLPSDFVNSQVWDLLHRKYPSIIREAIKCSYDAKKKRQKVSMELIYLRASKYLGRNGPATTPNKLNDYQS